MLTSQDTVPLKSIVEAALIGLPAELQNAEQTIVNDGSAHVVVLLEEHAAVRITRDVLTADRFRRRQELVDSIPHDIGLSLPRSLGPVVDFEGYAAVTTEFVSGSPCPAGEGSPEEIARLLTKVATIPIAPLQGILNEPLSFCGGAQWYSIQLEEVLPRIDPSYRPFAREALEKLAHLAAEDPVFSHGDLGAYNVMWQQGQATGILDWDLSSGSDRSTDLASLGTWHGWEKLTKIASANQIKRAAIRRNTFRLQQLGFLVVSQRPESEILAAVDRANQWISKNLATE